MSKRKPKISDSTTNRRSPTQIRSREKVEKILLAVKTLIEKEGVANLKIGEIAKLAGVSPSSIYQYFSDKETIVIALAEHYMVQIRALIEKNLDKLEEHAQIASVIRQNFYDIYELHRKEPALRQIWFESVDPRLNKLAFEDTQKNADLIMNRIEPFIEEQNREQLAEFVLLVTHQFAATMRLNIVCGEAHGTNFIDMHANMVTACLEEYVGVDAF